jgi:hypothetical protein
MMPSMRADKLPWTKPLGLGFVLVAKREEMA